MKPGRLLTWTATLAVFLAVVWFYYWTVGSPQVFRGAQNDYYNLLLDGFKDGHLAMKVTPDPWLGVDNTRVKSYLMDASFYRGKYYLYFGVTPVLVLFWPWSAITGHDLPIEMAAMLLASMAYLLSIGWLWTLKRRFFPTVGGLYWVVAVAILGLAPAYPVVLRRPLFYEVAILCGLVCSFGGLWCLTLAVLRGRHGTRWLGVGSLAAGLAAGSRPTLIPGALLAVSLTALLLGWRDWRESGRLQGGRLRWLVLAAVLPAGLCGLGLAWYNWARFDSPLDFGLMHQVAANGNGFPFTLGFLWKNLKIYYFTLPDFSWFFPFFAPGAKPYGSYQEQVHGQFYILPLFALAVCRGWVGWRRADIGTRELRLLIPIAGVWAGCSFVFVTMCWAHANRYLLDFHPVFIVLALLGLFASLEATAGWRRATCLAVLWSAVVLFYNICTSFHVHGFFLSVYPRQYEAMARVADRLVWPLHRLAGPRLGGLEVVVKFPRGTPGTMEPLLVAGGGPDLDALLIRYTTPGMGRLVFMHLGFGEVESADFDLQEGRARWLKIHLGTLYPPAGHPWYDALPLDMARAINHVSVKIDGAEVLQRDVVCFQASANQVTLGARAGFPFGAERFSGEIARVRGLKADQAWLQALQQRHGAIRMRLELPRDRFGQEEPLLMTGERGRSDLVSITYVRKDVVRFSVWHDGWAGPRHSPEIEWDYRLPLEVQIALGSLRGSQATGAAPADGVTVEADGQVVLAQDYPTHPARPTQVYLGCIPWPLAGSRLLFGGQIETETAEDPEQGALRRAKQSLLAGRPLVLQLVFPEKSENQPVLTTGITGRGDGLYVEYLSATKVRFGFDHWGSQPLFSAPVTIEPGRPCRLVVSFGARVSNRLTVPGRLEVQLDGRPVFDVPVDLFPAEPDQVFFGANPIGMSTSRPRFTGGLDFLSGSRPARAP